MQKKTWVDPVVVEVSEVFSAATIKGSTTPPL